MLVGVVIGGIARLFLTDLTLWTFVSKLAFYERSLAYDVHVATRAW